MSLRQGGFAIYCPCHPGNCLFDLGITVWYNSLIMKLLRGGYRMTYKLIRSNRKTIAIQIKGDGRIIVRAPLRMAAKDIQRFVDTCLYCGATTSVGGSGKSRPSPARSTLCRTCWCHLWPHHHPGTEKSLGFLFREGQLELQLSADALPGGCPRLRGSA